VQSHVIACEKPASVNAFCDGVSGDVMAWARDGAGVGLGRFLHQHLFIEEEGERVQGRIGMREGWPKRFADSRTAGLCEFLCTGESGPSDHLLNIQFKVLWGRKSFLAVSNKKRVNYNSGANLGLYKQRIVDCRGRMNRVLL
jgi:hypothetical protein